MGEVMQTATTTTTTIIASTTTVAWSITVCILVKPSNETKWLGTKLWYHNVILWLLPALASGEHISVVSRLIL